MFEDVGGIAAEVRELGAGGWRFEGSELEVVGDRVRGVLRFRHEVSGALRTLSSSMSWPDTSSDDAWVWCDAWSRRALLWMETPDGGSL